MLGRGILSILPQSVVIAYAPDEMPEAMLPNTRKIVEESTNA